ncbi:ATP-dependent DNA ligase [Vibrio phage D69]
MAKVIPNVEIETPMLYKIDSQGVTRVWRAWTTLNEDGTAIENNESGIEGGTLSGIPVTVLAGKNIGKKNETTALQQANSRIQSKLTKKLREGYVENLEEFTQQGVMKAHEWKVSKHRMSQIALKQPKLDGIRCKAIKRGDTFTLMSKSNKEFKPFLYDLPWANYFRNEMDESEVDGEMYVHGLELNEIASLVMSYKLTTNELLEYCEDTPEGLKINLKKKEILDQVWRGEFCPMQDPAVKTPTFENCDPIEVGKNKGWIFPNVTTEHIETVGTQQLQFWAFDVPDAETMAEERNFILERTWATQDAEDHGIIAVIAEEFDIDDIAEANAEYVERGFEGTMVRLPSGLYAFGERTAALQKYKDFHDQEWEIKGYELDREGNPTFTFVSDAGVEFSSRPTGNRAWRQKLLNDIDTVIGKMATIRYQMLYQDSLCPQFGRVIAIRDYE